MDVVDCRFTSITPRARWGALFTPENSVPSKLSIKSTLEQSVAVSLCLYFENSVSGWTAHGFQELSGSARDYGQTMDPCGATSFGTYTGIMSLWAWITITAFVSRRGNGTAASAELKSSSRGGLSERINSRGRKPGAFAPVAL